MVEHKYLRSSILAPRCQTISSLTLN